MPTISRQGAARLALLAAVATMIALAYRAGLLQRMADVEQMRRTMVDLGALGYLAFVVSYAALQPFGVPGTVFVVVAPLIWPWPIAFALSMVGTMAASVIGFSFARFVARDWFSSRIPKQFRKYEAALERRGFVTVAVLRLIFWMPQPLHAFFGLSRVSFGVHFWGSLVGYVIPLLLVSIFGQRFFDFFRSTRPTTWIAVVAGLLVVAVAVLVYRRRHVRP